MKSESIEIKYETLSFDELDNKEKELIECAKKATYSAYSPYSSFSVGAAVRLENEEIVIGSNQENIAYPSGLCAERVALFSAGTRKEKITTLSPKESQEIELAISEAFSKKFIESRKKQLRSYLLTSEYWRAILNLK
ncbi:MAG: hypothetical protein J6V35_01355 [Bacteroidales bacterium]|nr:hypothetical protein [Bacteroidales bacterium]